MLYFLLLNGDLFTNTIGGHPEESENTQIHKFTKSKNLNKDSYASLCESFFQNSSESANLENLYDDRYLMKLKGGGKKEKEELKVKKFISET